MYSLKVVIGFTHPDGRLFQPGHDCHSLNAFEVAELLVDYPENFEPADELTKDFAESGPENLKHLADAKKRQDQGE